MWRLLQAIDIDAGRAPGKSAAQLVNRLKPISLRVPAHGDQMSSFSTLRDSLSQRLSGLLPQTQSTSVNDIGLPEVGLEKVLVAKEDLALTSHPASQSATRHNERADQIDGDDLRAGEEVEKEGGSASPATQLEDRRIGVHGDPFENLSHGFEVGLSKLQFAEFNVGFLGC